MVGRGVCIFLCAVFGLGVAAVPATAQGYFALSAGLYNPEDHEQDRTEVFEVRGGYRIKPQFGYEWSLGRLHLTDTVPFQDDPTIPGIDFDRLKLKLALYNLDLSAQWFPRGGNFLVFGGPGVAQLQSDLQVTFFGKTFVESDRTNLFTAHLGAAYTWNLSPRIYLRPEVRVRHYFGYDVRAPDRIEGFYYSYKATDYQAAVAFGWKFGT